MLILVLHTFSDDSNNLIRFVMGLSFSINQGDLLLINF